MDLSPVEISRLKAEDGLATREDLARIEGAGVDLDADIRFRASLQAALKSNPTQAIADGVMSRIGGRSLPLADAIRRETPQTVVDGVMASLEGIESVPVPVRAALSEEAGNPPPLWPRVAAAVGADTSVQIGDMLRSEIQQEGGFQVQKWPAARRRWVVGGAALACAAAASFLIGIGITNTPVGTAASAAIAPILDAPVDIEALEVGSSNSVQVLQFGNEAPTIIFVSDDLEGAQ